MFPLSQITDLVAIRLGEFPDWRRRRDDPCQGISLDEEVALVLPHIALTLTLEAPLDSLGECVDFRADIRSDTDWGAAPYGEFPLPDDFLRLKMLLMPDWSTPLSESCLGDPAVLALGNAAPDWLAARPRRPKAQFLNLGDTRILRFGPTDATVPTAASYVPRPIYDASSRRLLNLDRSLLFPLADAIASALKPDAL